MSKKENFVTLVIISTIFVILLMAEYYNKIPFWYLEIVNIFCIICMIVSYKKWHKKYSEYWKKKGHIEKTTYSYYKTKWRTGEKDIDSLHVSVNFLGGMFVLYSFISMLSKTSLIVP